jgi:hypothetical protein
MRSTSKRIFQRQVQIAVEPRAISHDINSASETAAKHHTIRQQSDIPDKTAMELKAILASRDAGNAGSCLCGVPLL